MSSRKHKQTLTELTIRKFDLDTLLTDAVIVIIGRRRQGKSFLMRDIMYHLSKNKNIPYGKVYSTTEAANPFFHTFFPSLFISSEFSEEELDGILESQRKKVRKTAKKQNTADGRTRDNNMLLVFDDMMSANEDLFRKSPSFKSIFTTGRHYNITFYLVLQCVLGIPPGLRENIDYAFLFSSDGSNLKKLWENYAGVIESFDMFKSIFFQCTRDRGCLVINKTDSSDDLTNKVFFYRASDPGPFRFGCKSFWKLHDERCKNSDDEDDEAEVAKKKLQQIMETYGGGKKYKISLE